MKEFIDTRDEKAWLISVVLSSICIGLLLIGMSWFAYAYYQFKYKNGNLKHYNSLEVKFIPKDISTNNETGINHVQLCMDAIDSLTKYRSIGDERNCVKYTEYLKSFEDNGKSIELYVKELHSEIK